MPLKLALLAAVTLAAAFPAAAQAPGKDPAQDQAMARARAVLKAVPIIDGHNDLPWALRQDYEGRADRVDLMKNTAKLKVALHTDIPRLRQGYVGGQFWSVYIPADITGPKAVETVFEQMDLVRRLVARYPNDFELAFTVADIERIEKKGKIASLMGMEGGHSINNSLPTLRAAYAAGARYMTLTHSANIDWADSATDAPKHGGLTRFGEEVVREMNRMGMLADLSHVSEETMDDVLRVAQAPVIFSHSSARAINHHARNVPDSILRKLPKNGGVVMVNFYSGFVSEALRQWQADRAAEEARLRALNRGDPSAVEAGLKTWDGAHAQPRATLAQVADHIDHIRTVAGVDHVGIGSDFDGIDITPDGLEGVETYPALFAELARRGWSDEDLKKLSGLNALRALRQAERVAAKLQAERGPSEATIQALDKAKAD